MATTLTVTASEEGTYIVEAAFTNSDGDAVTPETVTWTLTDLEGTVINSREDESITPASTVSIVLSGDDLALDVGVSYWREVTVEATYNSAEYGNNLPLKGVARFEIENLSAVS